MKGLNLVEYADRFRPAALAAQDLAGQLILSSAQLISVRHTGLLLVLTTKSASLLGSP